VSRSDWLGRQWRLIAALVAFALFAPVGLFALPLAALLVLSPPLRARVAFVAIVAGGFSLSWLLQPGDLPEQVVRAMSLIAVASFIPITFFTRASVCHSALAAGTSAVLAVTALLNVMGRPWGELRWWVEHRMGYAARIMARSIWSRQNGGGVEARQLEEVVEASVRFVADYHLALVTLQVIAGLSLATVVYHRLATKPRSVSPGRFSDFRFADQLGWVAIAALVVVLVPLFAEARVGALNVLLVIGTLFGIRGIAVVGLGMQRSGVSYAVMFLFVVAAILLLPAAIVGAILLGIVDTRFDLRRRWYTPPSGG